MLKHLQNQKGNQLKILAHRIARTKDAFVCFATAILFTAPAHAQPVMTRQPSDQSASLGASVKFQVSATSTSPPIRYQWRFAAADLAGQTNFTLTLTNIQVINAGD